jgi:hypothetical protein
MSQKQDVPEVDLLATYCQSDLECFDELPYRVREYMRGMISPPRSAIVLQALYVAGERAVLETLQEHDMMERLKGPVH